MPSKAAPVVSQRRRLFFQIGSRLSLMSVALLLSTQQLDAKPQPNVPEGDVDEYILDVEKRLLDSPNSQALSKTTLKPQHTMKPSLSPKRVEALKVSTLPKFEQSAASVMARQRNLTNGNVRNAKGAALSGSVSLPEQISEEFRNQLRKLRSLSTDNRVELRFDRSRRISGFSGNFKLPASDTQESQVSKIIQDHPAVFGIDANTKLDLQAICKQEMCTYKVHRLYRDLPMWGGDFTVTTQRDSLLSARGLMEVRDLDVSPPRAFLAEDIINTVATYFDKSTSQILGTPKIARGVRAKKPFPIHAYRVSVEFSVMERYLVFVSVETGQVIEVLSQVYTTFYDSSGADLMGQNQTFRSESDAGRYRLVDDQSPVGARTEVRDLDGGDIEGYNSAPLVTASSPTGPWNRSAVSAITNAKKTTDYFGEVHGRNGLDGSGGGSRSFVNVTFDGSGDNAMNYGNLIWYGTGGEAFSDLAAALDVAAHEFTHGVIGSTSNLDYSFQSGALNESFSDFFGATVDPDWTLGEDVVVVPPFFLRSMKTPQNGLSPQPGHMTDYAFLTEDEDKGGVHVNSGIPNRALYLLAEGLSDEGLGNSIGREKTEKIAYQTMITLPSTADFTQAAESMFEQAGILYGAAEREAVKAAFEQVGISVEAEQGKPPELPQPGTSNLAAAIYPSDDRNYLAIQLFDNDFEGYKADLFFTVAADEVTFKRPSMSTDSEGSGIVTFFNDANDMLYADIQTGEVGVLASRSEFQTIAFSPGLNKFAGSLTTGNILGICDLEKDRCDEYTVYAPSYSKDVEKSVPAEVIDAMDWDPTGRRVVFDFAICLETDAGECVAYQWSIGILNTISGRVTYPYSSQPTSISLGNPSFSNLTDRYIAFDYLESDATADNGVGYSSVLIYDTEDVRILPGPFPDASAPSGPNGEVMGFPSFTADDTGIVYRYLNEDGFPFIVFGEADGYEWTGSSSYMDPYNAELPTSVPYLYKPPSLELVASPTRLNFGELSSNSRTSQRVCITNSGSARITTDPATSNRPYVQPLLGGVVLVGGQKSCGEVEVNTAGLAGGSTFSAVIDLPSDGDRLQIPVSGRVSEVPPPSLGTFTTLLGTIESFLNGDESTSSETPPQPSAREAETQEGDGAKAIPMVQNLVLWILSSLLGVLGLWRLRCQ